MCAAASAVNFGNLRLQGRNPVEFPLSLRAQAIWEDLARLTGEDCGVVSLRARLSGLRAERPAEAGSRPRATPARPVSTWSCSMGPLRDAAGRSCRGS